MPGAWPPQDFAERNTTNSIPKTEGEGGAEMGLWVEEEAEAAFRRYWAVCRAQWGDLKTPELLAFNT